MKRLICLLSGHRFGAWKLSTLTMRNRVVIDTAQRACSCCHRLQVTRLSSI